MKKLFLTVIFAVLMAFTLSAVTPAEVLEKARTQANIKTMASEADVNIQQPVGKTIEILKLRQYVGKNANGLQSTMIIFRGPAKHKGTRFLMIERKDGSTDQRVFLPSLGKSRRIAAESEGSSSFFGTDFSYNDMAFMSRNVNLDEHSFLPEENYNGEDCFVIQSIPKDKKEAYSKSVCKVAKKDYRLLCAEFYNKDGEAVKLIECLDYESINGVMTPMNLKMTTKTTNTSTVISIKNIQYGLTIPNEIFTTRYLETGR